MSVGFPQYAILNQWAFAVTRIFDIHCLYQVGSSVDSKDWRDVDVVAILSDDQFAEWFPQNGDGLDMKWNGLCIAISCWGQRITGLPIDFKIQGQTQANWQHPGRRNALGLSVFNAHVPDQYKHRPNPTDLEKMLSDTMERNAKRHEVPEDRPA